MVQKPSGKEEEYFAREQYERQRRLNEEKHKAMAAEEKQRLRELHFMRCPRCGLELVEIDYRSIKIDKCTECQGVWLDAGELEAVAKLEKTAGMEKLLSVFRR